MLFKRTFPTSDGDGLESADGAWSIAYVTSSYSGSLEAVWATFVVEWLKPIFDRK
jgi:hypothetical protein